MWLGYAVTSSTLHADPPSNETIDVFYINSCLNYLPYLRYLWLALRYSLWSPEYFPCFLYKPIILPTRIYLHFVILSSRMFPAHFFSLSTISWIAISAPHGSARLIFSYCMLFWPLLLVASFPCCSILDPDLVSEFYAEKNVRHPQKILTETNSVYDCTVEDVEYIYNKLSI